MVGPAAAAAELAGRVRRSWAEAVCAETRGETYDFKIGLRPNVTSGAVVERELLGSWGEWRAAWRRIEMPGEPGSGVWVESSELSVAGALVRVPKVLRAPGLESAEVALAELGVDRLEVDLARAREVARRLRAAGASLSPATLKKAVGLAATDLEALLRVLAWLAAHPDVRGWSARQLPIPGVHTKWVDKFMTLIRALTGRDLDSELSRRPTAVHLTYVDPAYLAGGCRRHDAWTAGDEHDLAYQPRTVVVVENRDCRVFFPALEGAVVVEGGGSAATALVAEIPWVREADRVVYWGDMDAEGYAILDRFRTALPGKVESILMDSATMTRYAEQGVSVDKDGNPLGPCSTRLPELEEEEAAAYALIATSGRADFRRIEQEKLPIEEAVSALSSRPS